MIGRQLGAAALAALLCGCVGLGPKPSGPPAKPPGRPPPVAAASPACASLDNFFRANINNQWSAGGSIAGWGASASQTKIVEYERLTSDASKKQMALASMACELFEAGKLGAGNEGVTEYHRLLKEALNAGVRAEALNGDAAAFITQFKAALEESQARASVADRAQFTDLVTRMEKTLATEQANLPQLQAEATKASQNAEAARDFAFQALNTDVGAVQRLMMVEATVSTIQYEMDTNFRTIRDDIRKFKAKWGITDSDQVHCDQQLGPFEYLFSIGSQQMRPDDARILTKATKRFVQGAAGCRISAHITGFADPTGHRASNLALARRRAGVAGDVLRAAGIVTISETGDILIAETAGLGRRVAVTFISEPDLAPTIAAPAPPVPVATLQ